MRGIAALLVAMNHLQDYQFIQLEPIQNPAFLSNAFSVLTKLGGDAVLVFFVPSGYLVGGSVIKDASKSQWSWVDYLVKRFSRLWMVLIPALLLTLFWDSLGIRLNGRSMYEGNFWSAVVCQHDASCALDLKTFIGKCIFPSRFQG